VKAKPPYRTPLAPATLHEVAFREAIWDALQGGSRAVYRRFRPPDIDDLAHLLELYERNPWTPATVRAARRDPAFKTLFGEKGLRDLFGRGRRTRSHWSVMAAEIARRAHAALNGADQLAGEKRDRAVIKKLVLDFVHSQLVRIAARAGMKPPNREAVRKILNRWEVAFLERPNSK
jgi:hypothetical protein